MGILLHAEANERIVIFNKLNHMPVKVVMPGYWHVLLLSQEIRGRYPTVEAPFSTQLEHVYSKDGIPFSIEIQVVYGFDPNQIIQGHDKQVAASILTDLAISRSGMVQRQSEAGIRKVVSGYSSKCLCGFVDRDMLTAQIRDKILFYLRTMGLNLWRVTLGEIRPPQVFRDEMLQAHAEQIRAKSRAATQRIYGQLELPEQQFMLALEYAKALQIHGFPQFMGTSNLNPILSMNSHAKLN